MVRFLDCSSAVLLVGGACCILSQWIFQIPLGKGYFLGAALLVMAVVALSTALVVEHALKENG